jgi:hypothetical protein
MRDGQGVWEPGSRGGGAWVLERQDPGAGETEPGSRGWWEPRSRGEGSTRKGRGNRDKKKEGKWELMGRESGIGAPLFDPSYNMVIDAFYFSQIE